MRSNIKKIDDAFKAFVKSHDLINSYKSFDYNGESNHNDYPLLWVDMDNRRVPIKSGSFNHSIPVFLFVGKEVGDSGTMQAEAEQLAYDFLNHFADNEDVYKFCCDIESELTVVKNTIDKSEGMMFDIKLMLRAGQNQHAIPLF